MKSTMVKGSFEFYNNGTRIIVRYKLTKQGHYFSALKYRYVLGHLIIPVTERLTISKIEFYGRKIIKDSKVKLPTNKSLNI